MKGYTGEILVYNKSECSSVINLTYVQRQS